jgi:hypothetical protein
MERESERGHADDVFTDLSTPENDDQVEPDAEPWTEEDDEDAKHGSS